jgi:hypothetical protein
MARSFTVNVDGVDVPVNGAPEDATAVRALVLITYQGIDDDGDAFSSFGWAWSHMDVDARLGMITRGQKEIVREILEDD